MPAKIEKPGSEPVLIKHPHLLIVEGLEDARFFSALIEHMRLEKVQIQIIVAGGKTEIRNRVRAIANAPGFKEMVVSLGILRDANSDPNAAFQSIRDALKAVGLPSPNCQLEVVGSKPRVGVLILPGSSPGSLEDLCLASVTEDPAMACVEQYFECLKKLGSLLPDNISKAKIHVFLASRPKAGLRLGEAAEKGYWPWNHEAFEPIKNFIKNLVLGV